MLNRQQKAWAFYDFANSAYATSVLTFIFPFFFLKVLVPEEGVRIAGTVLQGSTLYPLLVAFSLFLVFVFTPFLGVLADRSGRRKLYLFRFCAVGSLATMGMFFLGEGDWLLGSLLFVTANIGFSGGNVFYNALLCEVAQDDEIAGTSARGWALGYAGGFLLLVAHLALLQLHESLGISKLLATRICLGSTGIWWFLFALPLFFRVREVSAPVRSEEKVTGFVSPGNMFRSLRGVPGLGFFLLSFFLYNDAVQTTISQSTNYAIKILSMELNQVLMAGVGIQFVAIFGSLLFLRLEKRFGSRRALEVALVQWLVILVWAALIQTQTEFYFLCAWVGLVLGVVQSASRTLYGKKLPRKHSALGFSFYAMADRASAIMGPLLYATADHFFHVRLAMVFLGLMLAVGLWLLKKS